MRFTQTNNNKSYKKLFYQQIIRTDDIDLLGPVCCLEMINQVELRQATGRCWTLHYNIFYTYF